jgi:hypothetical protein
MLGISAAIIAFGKTKTMDASIGVIFLAFIFDF